MKSIFSLICVLTVIGGEVFAAVTSVPEPTLAGVAYGTQDQENPTHSANFGVKLQEKCLSEGVECELVYPGAPGVRHATAREYLIDRLKSPEQRAVK